MKQQTKKVVKQQTKKVVKQQKKKGGSTFRNLASTYGRAANLRNMSRMGLHKIKMLSRELNQALLGAIRHRSLDNPLELGSGYTGICKLLTTLLSNQGPGKNIVVTDECLQRIRMGARHMGAMMQGNLSMMRQPGFSEGLGVSQYDELSQMNRMQSMIGRPRRMSGVVNNVMHPPTMMRGTMGIGGKRQTKKKQQRKQRKQSIKKNQQNKRKQ